MPRWFKITLISICSVILLAAAAFLYTIWSIGNATWDFSGADDGHWAAHKDFITTLGEPSCLTREAIIAEAQRREWTVRNEGDFAWCHAPTGLSNWLRVPIEPSLFMSTEDENAVFFGFDSEGCSQDWSYANGDGTTCPDT